MSSKITKLLTDAVDRYEKILDQELRGNKEIVEVNNLRNHFAEKLKSERKDDLNNALIVIQNLLISISSAGDEEQPEQNHVDSVNQRRIALFQKRIVEEALRLREEDRKKKTHLIERNYAEAPIFNAHVPTNASLVKLQNKSGELIEERTGYRKIRYTSKEGKYLTHYDFKNFVGLQKLWELKGEDVSFSFHLGELAEVVGDAKEGGIYEAIDASLIKLSTTSLVIEEYRDPTLKKKITTDVHNLIASARIDHENKMGYVTFNPYLHEGLKAGNVVRINLSLYQDFNSQTSKLLYPLLSSLLRDRQELELDDLINNMGMQNMPRKKVFTRIRKALNDMVDANVIENFEFKRFQREYKSVVVVPSNELLESFEQGIVIPRTEEPLLVEA